MTRDQVVSVLRHEQGWVVLLTMPVGANDSFTTKISDHQLDDEGLSSRIRSKHSAHIAALDLWGALNEHNKDRPTKFATDDPSYLRRLHHYPSDKPVVSALVPVQGDITEVLFHLGITR